MQFLIRFQRDQQVTRKLTIVDHELPVSTATEAFQTLYRTRLRSHLQSDITHIVESLVMTLFFFSMASLDMP